MPVVDVMEEKKVKCSIELKGEKYAAATECEFAFFDEAKAAIGERLKATVSGGKGEAEWTAPKLAETDGLSKKASYKVFVGEEEYGGFEQDLLIWAKDVTVTVKDANEATKALVGAAVRFTQEGVDPPVVRKTDDAGVVKYPLQKPVPVKTEFVSPFELDSWTKGKALEGRAREAKAKRKPYKAAFFAPVWKSDKTATVHKQYVNLTGAVADEGHTLKVKVGPATDKDKPPAERLGLKDDVIHVKVEFRATGSEATKNSKRNKPKPCLMVAGTETASPATVKLGEDGAPAEFEVELGYAGGDEVTIKIGVTDACDDAELKVVTWRKIFYELMVPQSMVADMGTGPLSDGTQGTVLKQTYLTKIENTLKPCFIEYVCHKTHVFPDANATGFSMVDAEYVGKTGRKQHVLSSKWAPLIPTGAAYTDDKGNVNILLRLADVTLSVSADKVPLQSVNMSARTANVPTNGGMYSMAQSTKTATATETIFVTGCKWTTKMSTSEKANYKLKLGAFTGPDSSTVPPGQGKGRALKVVAEGLDLEQLVYFEKPGTLKDVVTEVAATEKTNLTAFVKRVIQKAITQKTLELKFKIFGETGNSRRTDRFNNVKAYITEAFDGEPGVWLHPGLEQNGTRRTGPMKKTWITHKDWSNFTITIPSGEAPGTFVGALDATHCPVTAELQWEETYEINGCASSPQVLVYVPNDDRYGITYCHELGHSMGMTIMHRGSKAAPGLTAPKHVDEGGDYYRSVWYSGETKGSNGIRNHAGSHCAFSVADKTAATFDEGDGTCALFGEGPGVRTGFCPTCVEHIRARKLTDLRADWDGRADDDY